MIEAGNAEKTHMADLFIRFARGRILSVGLEAVLGVGRLAARNQPIALGNHKLLFPASGLLIGGLKRDGQLAFLRRGWSEAASIHLRNIGD